MKCLIVEDEPIAREIVRSYIERTPGLSIASQCKNAIEAQAFLKVQPVDLMFLDIKMPQMSGIELLTRLANKPKTIITSAFRYYATDAFDLDVIDFLLKPYSYERFSKAIHKTGLTTPQTDTILADKPHFFVKGNKQLHKVFFSEILYLESQRDYVRFKLADGSDVTTRNTISYYEQFLPAQLFVRVHRSFIVSLPQVVTIEATVVRVGAYEIPIGRNFRTEIVARFENQSAR